MLWKLSMNRAAFLRRRAAWILSITCAAQHTSDHLCVRQHYHQLRQALLDHLDSTDGLGTPAALLGNTPASRQQDLLHHVNYMAL